MNNTEKLAVLTAMDKAVKAGAKEALYQASSPKGIREGELACA